MPLKIIKTIMNVAQIAPIGSQFPKQVGSSYEDLAYAYPDADQSALPGIDTPEGTLDNTDAGLLHVSSRSGTVMPNSDVTVTELRNLMLRRNLPYVFQPVTAYMGVLGVSIKDVANNGAAAGAKLMTDALDTYIAPDLTSSGSTCLAAFVGMVDNLNVKVQNAFNRPLPFNDLTREQRYIALYNYHCDLFQCLAMFDYLSGAYSFINHASESHAFNVSSIQANFFNPDIVPKMQAAYRMLEGMPILDTLTASRVQRHTKFYAANEKIYFPGAYFKMGVRIPIGHISGTVGSGTSLITFNTATKLSSQVSGTTLGGAFSSLLLDELDFTLVFEKMLGVLNSIISTYSIVIQFLIQAVAKNITTINTIAPYIDFTDSFDSAGGVNIYTVIKDQDVNNYVAYRPTYGNFELGGVNASFIVCPTAAIVTNGGSATAYVVNADTDTDATLASGQTKKKLYCFRKVSPYLLKKEIFDAREVLSMGVYHVYNGTSYALCYATNCVTGEVVPNGTNYIYYASGVSLSYPRIAAIDGTFASGDGDILHGVSFDQSTYMEAGNDRWIKAINEMTDIINQFGLEYLTLVTQKVTGAADFDILLFNKSDDQYWLRLPITTLEQANSQVYKSLYSRISWMAKPIKPFKK